MGLGSQGSLDKHREKVSATELYLPSHSGNMDSDIKCCFWLYIQCPYNVLCTYMLCVGLVGSLSTAVGAMVAVNLVFTYGEIQKEVIHGNIHLFCITDSSISVKRMHYIILFRQVS